MRVRGVNTGVLLRAGLRTLFKGMFKASSRRGSDRVWPVMRASSGSINEAAAMVGVMGSTLSELCIVHLRGRGIPSEKRRGTPNKFRFRASTCCSLRTNRCGYFWPCCTATATSCNRMNEFCGGVCIHRHIFDAVIPDLVLRSGSIGVVRSVL